MSTSVWSGAGPGRVAHGRATEGRASDGRGGHGWIVPLLGMTLVLNLLDLAFTLYFVLGGHAVEANPVMATALQLGPTPFAVVKLTLVSTGVYVLFRFRHKLLARLGSVIVFAAYAMLGLYHVHGVALIAAG